MVHPSTVEGLAFVFIEGGACGTPVLAAAYSRSRGGQCSGGWRMHFPERFADYLARQIVEHFSGRPIPVGQADHLDWTIISRQLEETYQRLLHQGRTGHRSESSA